MITETTSFEKDGKTVVFNVYPDNKIGFDGKNIPSVPMTVDEDCATTSSVKK